MNEHTDPDATLARRLGALGSQPVEPAVASQHLTAMASVPARPAGGLRQKLQVAGALVAGLLIGSTGLAVAGALPDPLQDASSTALGKVNLDVPAGTERFDGIGTSDVVPPGFYLVVVEDKGGDCGEWTGAWPLGFLRAGG